MSTQKMDDDNGGRATRSRTHRGQTSSSGEKAVPAGQQTEQLTMEGEAELAIDIETRIKEALCSEEVLKALVKAVTESILERVTQKVYKAVKMDTEANKTKMKDLEKQVSQLKEDLSSAKKNIEFTIQFTKAEIGQR